MSRKSVFLSTVSRELGDMRKLLDTAFSRHFDVITQERSLNQHPGRGIREVLADAIGEADCVIHLAGRGFGSTADAPYPEHPAFTCSWTQFEYYHAHLEGKPVFALICGPSLADPDFVETADPALGVDEKTRLQREHCARVVSGRFEDPPFTSLPRTTNNREEKTDREALLEAAISICAQMAATDPAYSRVQADLRDILASLARIEKGQKHLLRNSALALASLALIGGGVWHIIGNQGETDARIDTTNDQISRLDQKVDERFTEERHYMALILARSNDRLKDWESMPPAERFDLALDEIAAEQDIPADELRALLDLYVSLVEADPDPDALDRYYVQMRQQAFAEAANTAETEAEAAVARMEAAETKSRAAQRLLDREKKNASAERERAINFFRKEGDAHFTAGDYRSASQAYGKSAALIDKAAAPLEWAYAQENAAECLFLAAEHFLAEPLMMEILALREARLPPEHPAIAVALNNLAQLYQDTNRLKEAEPLMERALHIDETALGKEHTNVGIRLSNLAQLYQDTNRFKQAEELMQSALRIFETAYGEDEPEVVTALSNLASLFLATGRLKEAEPMLERALRIDEVAYGEDHPILATSLHNLASLYLATGRLKEAEPMLARALRINEAAYGEEHPKVATALNTLANFYYRTNRLKEAEQLTDAALRIDEIAYGENHPKVALRLSNLAQLYQDTNRFKEAEELMERALRIDVAAYGEDHPDVARDLNNLAQLCRAIHRLEDAESLGHKAVIIHLKFTRVTRRNHPNLRTSLANYCDILEDRSFPRNKIASKVRTLGPEAGWEQEAWDRKLAELFAPAVSAADEASAFAMEAYRKGDHAAALGLWSEALDLQKAAATPDAGAMRITRMNIASCRVFLGEHAAARDELQAIITELDVAETRDSLAARARHHLARALVALDEKPSATAALEEAIAIYKELPAEEEPPGHIKESEELLKQLQR